MDDTMTRLMSLFLSDERIVELIRKGDDQPLRLAL